MVRSTLPFTLRFTLRFTLLAPLVPLLGALGCGPGLRIDAVKPSTTAPGATVDIEGDGFGAGLSFQLLEGQIQLQSVEAVDATHARATIPAAAPNGTFTLVAARDGAEAKKPEALTLVADALRVHFLDIGQGDATLVVAPTGESLLIDGGPRDSADVVRNAIDEFAGGTLDAVVLSHTDADHLGGVVEVLRGEDHVAGTQDDLVPAQRYSYVDDGSCDSLLCGTARNMRAWPFTVASVGDEISLGDVKAEIVAADGDVGGGRLQNIDADNERSVVVRLEFAGKSVLVTGDLTGGGLGDVDLELPLSAQIGHVDVLRLSHHGSATSSHIAALQGFSPRAVVVSVGTDNAYCHPAVETTEALAELGARVFATGAGMVHADDCGETTTWPAGSRVGLGTFTLAITADGAMSLAGETL
jgi:competence protein ComEC